MSAINAFRLSFVLISQHSSFTFLIFVVVFFFFKVFLAGRRFIRAAHWSCFVFTKAKKNQHKNQNILAKMLKIYKITHKVNQFLSIYKTYTV